MSDDNEKPKSESTTVESTHAPEPAAAPPVEAPIDPPQSQTITLSASLSLMVNGFDANINACLPEIAKVVRKLKKLEGVEASSVILTVLNSETKNQNRYQMLVSSKKKPNGKEDFQVMPL